MHTIRAYYVTLKFEWDEAKNQANIAKHGVSFEQEQQIFAGLVWTRVDERMDYGETRLISMGILSQAAILVVAHTERTGATRIISARPANRKERRRYYEEVQRVTDS